MTAQTSRYGIQYPTGSDLVSNIPQHMQNAANSIEKALADVDDRHTTAAHSPVVRKNKAELDSAGGQPGQIGIVTAESNPALSMYYIRSTGGWVRLFTDTKVNQLSHENPLGSKTISWKVPYSDSKIQLIRVWQFVFLTGAVKFNASGQLNHTKCSETIPLGYRPTVNDTIVNFCGNAWPSMFINADGSVRMLGNPLNQYAACSAAWFTTNPWPAD